MVTRARAWRNAALAATTAIVAGLVFAYPSSTAGSVRGNTATVAPVGVVGVAGTESTGAADSAAGGHGAHGGFEGEPKPRFINGPAIDTDYGPVQVQIRVIADFIMEAKALAYPQATLVDKAINKDAIPRLEAATLEAQGAQIDTVSGATATSEGYRQSLQAALDAAYA